MSSPTDSCFLKPAVGRNFVLGCQNQGPQHGGFPFGFPLNQPETGTFRKQTTLLVLVLRGLVTKGVNHVQGHDQRGCRMAHVVHGSASHQCLSNVRMDLSSDEDMKEGARVRPSSNVLSMNADPGLINLAEWRRFLCFFKVRVSFEMRHLLFPSAPCVPFIGFPFLKTSIHPLGCFYQKKQWVPLLPPKSSERPFRVRSRLCCHRPANSKAGTSEGGAVAYVFLSAHPSV